MVPSHKISIDVVAPDQLVILLARSLPLPAREGSPLARASVVATIAALSVIMPVAGYAQSVPSGIGARADWPVYGGDAGSLKYSQLSDINKSNVARLCARMTEMGHVRQAQSETDGRSRRVALTEKGDRVAREVEAASFQRFELLLTAVPVRQRDAVLSGLDDLVRSVEELTPAEKDDE